MEEFVNWSGSVHFRTSAVHHPRSEDDVVALVREASRRGGHVRPVGSGHSSTPLVATDDTLVSLDRMTGVVHADTEERRATLLPGTGLADAGAALEKFGLAMENLGDVDYQTIAGAVGTATHGTGRDLGNLSSTLVGGRLVTGTGEILSFGEGDDLLRAAKVALGALGVFTALQLRLDRSFTLHRQNWITHIEWVLENFDELSRSCRHVDFYWYPRSDLAQVRILTPPGGEPSFLPPGRLKTEETGPSYEIIPNFRDLKFEEMEYMVPVDAGLDVFQEIRERVKKRHRDKVGWRILVRTIAPDDAMLSNVPQPTMTIALLQNATLEYEHYFRDLEPIFLMAGGRPHWGKKHYRSAADLERMYPEWNRFLEIRQSCDPSGVFLNDYLTSIFGLRRNR